MLSRRLFLKLAPVGASTLVVPAAPVVAPTSAYFVFRYQGVPIVAELAQAVFTDSVPVKELELTAEFVAGEDMSFDRVDLYTESGRHQYDFEAVTLTPGCSMSVRWVLHS